jgi:anti-anti-sigma factor
MRSKSDSQQPSATELANGYSLSRTARNGDLTLDISGEIDISNAEAFTDQVNSLDGGGDGQLTLDLQKCLFIDSTGIRALMALAKEQQARGQTLELSGVTGEPRRVLGLTGLLDSGLFAGSFDEEQKEAAVTHLKCPECGITLIDRSGKTRTRCPRCLLRSGAVVEMIRRMREPSRYTARRSRIKPA